MTIQRSTSRASRFSLASLLLTVACIAIICAAIASPAGFIGSLFRWLISLVMLVALVAPIYRTGKKRAFWIGFAIFAWGWIVITQSPFATGFSSSISGSLVTYVHSTVFNLRTDIRPYWNVVSAIEVMIVATLGGLAARYFWRTQSG